MFIKSGGSTVSWKYEIGALLAGLTLVTFSSFVHASSFTSKSASYSRSGFTIEFSFSCDGGCDVGKFATGWDIWVAPKVVGGSVEIASMSPPITGTGANLRNGAMADVQAINQLQGWNGFYEFESSKTIHTPYTADTSAIGRPVVLMKAISVPKNTSPRCTTERFCVEYVETLTILPSAPTESVFRPPYFGEEKPLISASNFSVSELKSLKVPSGLKLDVTEILDAFRSVQLGWAGNYALIEAETPRVNSGNAIGAYPAKVSLKQIPALLALSMDIPKKKKAQLALYIAQAGIDYYYAHKNGATGLFPCAPWVANGGYNVGRLPIILIASALLSKQVEWNAAINAKLSTPTGKHCFAETGSVQPPKSTGKNVALYGSVSVSGHTVYATDKTAADPYGLRDGGGNSSSTSPGAYQVCCTTGPWLGSSTAVRLIDKENFPSNALHWLEYVDRSRRTGLDVGAEFGAFADPSSFKATGYSPHYSKKLYFYLYDKYQRYWNNTNSVVTPSLK